MAYPSFHNLFFIFQTAADISTEYVEVIEKKVENGPEVIDLVTPPDSDPDLEDDPTYRQPDSEFSFPSDDPETHTGATTYSSWSAGSPWSPGDFSPNVSTDDEHPDYCTHCAACAEVTVKVFKSASFP